MKAVVRENLQTQATGELNTINEQGEANMKDFLWWRDGVVYQIYPRSFADSSGDGIGDLNGITNHLDYLQELGIDALWLSPINPSPDVDFGYDVSDYNAIDPKFGTMQDFERLVAQAEKRSMRIVMDLVLNHTSDQHEWFRQSRSSRDNPYRDWYIWHDPDEHGRPPNNWLSVFGGKGWEWDVHTQAYYYHMFYKEQPDLNWRNPKCARLCWMCSAFGRTRASRASAWMSSTCISKTPSCAATPSAGWHAVLLTARNTCTTSTSLN